MSALEYINLVKEIEIYLVQAIEDLPQERSTTHAENILEVFISAQDFDKLLRNENTPLNDKKNIQLSINRIQLAIKSLNKIGTIGQIEIAKAYLDEKQKGLTARGLKQQARLISELSEISKRLETAYSTINDDHLGAIAILSGVTESHFKKSRPENWTSKKIAKIAAEIFETETGRNASLTNHNYRSDEEAKGKFFIFLSGLFEILDIQASVEAAIKKMKG